MTSTGYDPFTLIFFSLSSPQKVKKYVSSRHDGSLTPDVSGWLSPRDTSHEKGFPSSLGRTATLQQSTSVPPLTKTSASSATAPFGRKFRVRKCSIVEEDEEDLDEEDEVDEDDEVDLPTASVLVQKRRPVSTVTPPQQTGLTMSKKVYNTTYHILIA